MGLFNDPTFEEELLAALRNRLISAAGSGPASVINNVYGGGGAVPASAPTQDSSLYDKMTSGPEASNPSPEMFDYLVDISRRNVYDEDNELIGWNKLVKRSRMPTDDDLGKKKELIGRQLGQRIREQ